MEPSPVTALDTSDALPIPATTKVNGSNVPDSSCVRPFSSVLHIDSAPLEGDPTGGYAGRHVRAPLPTAAEKMALYNDAIYGKYKLIRDSRLEEEDGGDEDEEIAAASAKKRKGDSGLQEVHPLDLTLSGLASSAGELNRAINLTSLVRENDYVTLTAVAAGGAANPDKPRRYVRCVEEAPCARGRSGVCVCHSRDASDVRAFRRTCYCAEGKFHVS